MKLTLTLIYFIILVVQPNLLYANPVMEFSTGSIVKPWSFSGWRPSPRAQKKIISNLNKKCKKCKNSKNSKNGICKVSVKSKKNKRKFSARCDIAVIACTGNCSDKSSKEKRKKDKKSPTPEQRNKAYKKASGSVKRGTKSLVKDCKAESYVKNTYALAKLKSQAEISKPKRRKDYMAWRIEIPENNNQQIFRKASKACSYFSLAGFSKEAFKKMGSKKAKKIAIKAMGKVASKAFSTATAWPITVVCTGIDQSQGIIDNRNDKTGWHKCKKGKNFKKCEKKTKRFLSKKKKKWKSEFSKMKTAKEKTEKLIKNKNKKLRKYLKKINKSKLLTKSSKREISEQAIMQVNAAQKKYKSCGGSIRIANYTPK